MHRIFVTDKPIFVSSNRHLNDLKRKLGIKKAGFSGTLDPFATGCLIVATGAYTKLLPYLKKTPKRYRATLWLGAVSASMDIENIKTIHSTPPLDKKLILQVLASLQGKLTYRPPLFSAKKIKGKRAYDLARKGETFDLKPITSIIYDIRLVHYHHPFLTFETTVSEGTYIRSLASIIAERLNTVGTLSSLRRLQEGEFMPGMPHPINPFLHLRIPQNHYVGNYEDLQLGKKLSLDNFDQQKNGTYWVATPEFYTLIAITDGKVTYKLNRLPKPTS